MPSTTSNIITTTTLTLVCAAILFIAYRHALRPILHRYNIPLQSLPAIFTQRSRGWMDSRYQRINSDGDYDSTNEEDSDTENNNTDENPNRSNPRNVRRLSRDLEEGFRDDSDSEDEVDRRFGRSRDNLRELPPTPVDDDQTDRFPATRI